MNEWSNPRIFEVPGDLPYCRKGPLGPVGPSQRPPTSGTDALRFPVPSCMEASWSEPFVV